MRMSTGIRPFDDLLAGGAPCGCLTTFTCSAHIRESLQTAMLFQPQVVKIANPQTLFNTLAPYYDRACTGGPLPTLMLVDWVHDGWGPLDFAKLAVWLRISKVALVAFLEDEEESPKALKFSAFLRVSLTPSEGTRVTAKVIKDMVGIQQGHTEVFDLGPAV